VSQPSAENTAENAISSIIKGKKDEQCLLKQQRQGTYI
jgi:hypothetical protein